MLIKSQTTKTIAANTVWQLVGKTISMTITIITVFIVTRIYGREGYGEFSLMQAWSALVFIIVDFGLNAVAAKDLSKDWSKAPRYIGNILIIRVILSVSLMFILSLTLALFPYSETLKFGIRLALLLILTQALYSTLNIIFQVKLRYKYSVYGYVGGYLIILFLVIFLSLKGASVVWVNFSYVVGGFITYILNLHFIKKIGVKIDFGYDPGLWRHLIVQSLPLGLMFVFSQLNFKSDALMLSVLKLPQKYGLNNTESVAVYNLPYKVFEVSLVLPTFFMNAAYPIFVRHSTESAKKLKRTFYRSLKTLALLGIGGGVVGVYMSGFIIKFLGGSDFFQSILVLQILLGGVVIYFISSPLSWLIVTLDKQVYLPYIYLLNAVFNITANLIFIPRYSFYAAAVVTHLSELIILALLIIAARRAWYIKYDS